MMYYASSWILTNVTKKVTKIKEAIKTIDDKDELEKEIMSILAADIKNYERHKEKEVLKQRIAYAKDPGKKLRANKARLERLKQAEWRM